jgi:hypothetical protein
VKLPLNVPLEIEHVGAGVGEKRPDGVTSNVHVVPAKFEPEAVTAVPTMPDEGVKMKIRGPVTAKGADSVSPAFVFNVTV